jgi:hypothetical protein
LDRPANTLYRHNLTATLESAIRGSNAQFDSPEILRRLDARMLELSHGELGWDVFTLEYKIEAPLNVIVTPKCAREYLKVPYNPPTPPRRPQISLNLFSPPSWGACGGVARTETNVVS